MKKARFVKVMGILFASIMLFVSIFGALPVGAADNAPVSKISSLLSMRINLKKSYLAKGVSTPQQKITLPGGDIQTAGDLTQLNQEKVYLYFTQRPTAVQINELAAMGVIAYPDSWIPPVKNNPTGFILADMPVDKLDALAAKAYVIKLDTAEETYYPQNDLGRTAMGVDSVWSGGNTGTGITVAVLDSGIDSSNPDFPTLNTSNSKDYSNYPTLDDTITNTVTGHGTHVTGSVLGRGVNSATYKGVAPGANLVFLKIGGDTSSSASSAAIIGAIQAAVDIYHASIITMSYGGWSQYHDGSDALCQAVDYAVSQGTTVFMSAGNNGSYGWHYSGTVAANNTTADIPVTVTSGYTSSLYMDMAWFDGLGTHNGLNLQYYNSSHVLLSPSSGGQSESPRGTEANTYWFGSQQSSGTYYLRVQNTSSSIQTFHIYYLGGSGAVTFSSPDPNYTLGSPAEADGAIAVGAYVTRSSWTNYKGSSYNYGQTLNSIATFSSRGPRVDSGAPNKPEIVAPGSAIISARDPLYALGSSYDPTIIDNDGIGLGPSNTGPANYFVMQGTSMACPLAAGVGALLLSKNPLLTPAQVKNVLETTATDKGTGGFDTIYGYGLINASAAVASITSVNVSISTAPVVGASVDANFTTQPVILVKDQSNNPISGITVTAWRGTGTGTLRGTLTAVSNASGLAAFTNLGYNKSGEAFTIHFTVGGLTLDSASLGPLATGATTQVKVETAADGSGGVIATRILSVGLSLTAYSITRDQYNNFVANAAANSWSLINKTGGVVDGDLVPSGDNKSAVLTGNLAGTAVIHTAIPGLTSTDSGTITILLISDLMTFLGMNVNMVPFTDVRVRQAIYIALNRDTIATNFGGTKVVSIVTPGIPSPNVNRAYDPTTALQLLTQAGYPAGFAITLTINPDPEGIDVAQIIKSNLAQVGINVTISIVELPVFNALLASHNLAFFLAKAGFDNSTPQELLGRLFLNSSFYNFTGYNQSQFDSLFNTAQYGQAESFAFDTASGGLPIVPLFSYKRVHHLVINTQPASTLSVDSAFSTQPVVTAYDVANNSISGARIVADRDPATGTGTLRGTLSVTTDGSGQATFTNLAYDKIDAFKVRFTCRVTTIISNQVGPLSAGAATQVKVETAANGSGTVVPAQNLYSGNTLTVYSITRDQYGNFVANAAATSWSLTGKTGGVVDGDLVPAGDNKSAVMTGHLAGTATIHTVFGSFTGDSGLITVSIVIVDHLVINTQPASTLSVDSAFSTQPIVTAYDAGNNPISGVSIVADRDPATGTGSLRGTLSVTTNGSGQAIFTNLAYNKTDAFKVRFTCSSKTIISNQVGPLTAGAATKVKVETAANGSGMVVPAQSISAGSSLTAYSITRDQYDNFVANAAATSWSLTGKTGGVIDADLVPAGDNKSAVMTGHFAGTAVIHTAVSGLTSSDSGTITVIAANVVAYLVINTQPASTLSVDSPFSTQPVVTAQDVYNNPISGVSIVADRDPSTGTGTLRGTLSVTTNGSGQATFTDMAYDKTDAFKVRFISGAKTIISNQVGPLTAGAATQVKVETAANGSGTVVPAQNLYSGNTLTVYSITRDQYGNFAANAAADSWSLTGKTGGVVDGDLVAAGDKKSAVMTGHSAGTATIHTVIGSFTGDSGSITVLVGTVDHLVINTQPASTLSVDSPFNTAAVVTAYDAGNNPVSGAIIVADRDPSTGTGSLRGTLSVTANGSGQATFSNLAYNKTDAFKVRFTSQGKTIISNQVGPLTAGAAATISINTAPVVGASVDVNFTTQPVILVVDQFSNPVSGVTVTASRGTGTGTLRGTLTATSAVSTGLATFTNLGYNKSGEAFTIHFAAGIPTVDSASLGPLAAGAAATISISTAPVVGASVDANLATQPVILVVDQFSNPVSGVIVTASRGTGTGTLRGTLTATSAATTGLATFTNLGYNKSGEAFTIHFAAGTPTVDSASLGPLSAGAATQIKVETAANGSGTVVPAQNLSAGSTLTVYSITRDQYSNYVANAAADSWSFASKSGGVVDGDLVAAGDKKSAVMTGHLIGTGVIHAPISGLTGTDSGTITVIASAVDHLQINTQPASTLSVDSPFSTQPVVTAYDAGNNPVSGVSIVADRDPATGTGTLRGTLSVNTNVSGQATFTDMAYNKTDAFKVRFTCNTKTIISNQVGPLTAGAAATISISTAPVVGASVDVNFTTQPVILVVDQFSNPVSGVIVTASRGTGTGTLRGTLTATSAVSTGLAAFTNLGYNKSGEAFTIHFAAGTPTVDSASLGPLAAGAATQIRVETATNGSGTVVPAQNLSAGSSLTVYSVTRDQYSNYVANATADSWSFTSKSGGVVNGDLVAAGDNKSAVMTGHLTGTGIIHAAITGLTSTDSGTITVIASAVDHLVINTQPASTLSVDSAFNTAAIVTAYDAGNNPISGASIVADRDPATGSGALRGTLSVNTNGSGQATFTNLAYNKTDAFKVRFTSGGKTIISNQVGPLAAGAAATISISTAPVVGASVDVNFTTQPVILVVDQFSNPVSGVIVTASRGTGTGTLRGTLTATSAVSTGLATFTNLGYNKSGEAFTIHFAAGIPTADSASLGPLAAGAATQVRVETAANGSGTVVPAQNLSAGSTLTVYSITRDQYNNFVENAAATSWSFSSKSGGVADGDLVPAGDNKSAVMTGHLTGTGVIHAAIATLTSTDSGTITVIVSTVDHLVINTQPASTLSVDSPFNTQPVVTAYDVGNNPISGVSVVADRDPATGSGALRGTLSVTTNGSGQATFTNLAYNKTDTFKVRFTCNTKTIISNQVGPLVAGAATTISISTAPVVGASVDANLATQPVILVVDQFSNPASGVTVTASRGTGTGILRGTLTATSAVSTGLASFTNLGYNKSGEAFTIHFAAGALTTDSASLGPLTAGAATQVRVETVANGSGTVVLAQNLSAGSALTVYSVTRDQYDNFVANAAATSWSFASKSGGVIDGDLVPAGDNKSAVMTGHLVGTGVIHATIASLTSTDSGIITVIVSAVDHLQINTQPASTLSVDSAFSTQPVVTVYDVGNNPISGVSVVADRNPATGTGTLRGTLSITTNGSGQATFTDLAYNKTDAFKVRFTCNTKTIISNQVSPLTAGAATQVRIETAANGSGTVVVAQSLYIGNTLIVYSVTRDQFSNYIANAAADSWSLTSITGGVVDGDLVPAGDKKSAVMTGHSVGTATIHIVIGSFIADSGIINIISSGGNVGGPVVGGIIVQTIEGITDITNVVNSKGVLSQDINAWSDDRIVVLFVKAGTTCNTASGAVLTQISILRTSNQPALPAGANFVSLTYEFGPTGATFSPTAIVRFTYEPNKIAAGVAETDLQIAYYDSTRSVWITLPSVIDATTRTITAQTNHFTVFAIVYGVKSPTITTPTTTPTSIPTSPTAAPTSTPPAITTLTTSTTPASLPTATATPNLIPTTASTSVSTTPVNWWLIGGIIAVVIIIALVIWWIMRRKQRN